MKHAAAFLLFFVALWWMWMLLAGEWNHTEWIAATAAAAAGAALAELARTRAHARPGLPLDVLRSVPTALAMVVVDFVLVLGALLQRRTGAFRTTKSDVAGDPQRRAWAAYLATLSPNAYVLDFDPEEGTALTHHFVVLPRSQEPA